LLSGHDFGVASVLQLAEALGLLPAVLWTYGIEIQSAEVERGPSPPVMVAAHQLARIITDELLQKFGLPTSSTLSG
jgi:Ni,Fe-hydrogenase maturation factor